MPGALALIGAAALLWPGADGNVARALASRDDADRLRAVLELARADPRRATPLLLPVLRDRDPNVRLAAARLLARRGAREAVVAATAWLGAPAPRERLLGLFVLEDSASLPDDARRAVERALRNGDLTTRLVGLDLMAMHPAPSSFAAVVALLDDDATEVRARALRALAALKDARASLPVMRRLGDSDRGVRMEAATTLGALGDRRVVPALLRQLDEVSLEPRTNVVDALGRLGDAAALPALVALARRSPRDDLGRHATLALGALGTPEAVEALLALARLPPGAADVRVALERAGARAVPRLCREIATGSPTSARLAAETLGRLADRRATGPLVAAVERGTGPLLAALAALERLADPAALPALLHVATDGAAPELRVLALDALEATGDARALVAVPRALLDPAASVRARAARLAGALGGAAEAPALAARLADPESEVRGAAADALARLPVVATWPAGVASALIETLSRAPALPADAATLDALAAALERAVTSADGAGLGRAYLSTASAPAREALARGLAAAFAQAPLDDDAVVAALARDVAGGGSLAPAAAEALGRARLSRSAQAALLVADARAEDVVRARLAPALASFDAGSDVLAREVADAGAAPSVRAAAAWALRGVSDACAVLRAATAAGEPAVAANARAALGAHTDARRARWIAVAGDGEPGPGRWVVVSAGDGTAVWALTDFRGRARLDGLPGGALSLSLAPR